MLAGEGLILRIARHEEARAGHLREQAILPRLNAHLPFQIPQWICQAGPSDVFPFGAVGYHRIFGIPFSLSLASQVRREAVAQDLAWFLVTLHRVPIAELTGLNLDAKPDLEALWTETRPVLSSSLTPAEYGKIRVWWQHYANDSARKNFKPRLVHGDPWGENVILHQTLDGIAGVVDFETVQIGDVAQDFAAQKYLGHDFLKQVIDHYQERGGELGNHFTSRLQDHSLLRELRGLGYAIRYPDSGELADALQKVRDELRSSL